MLTFIFPEVESVLLVGDDFLQVDDVLVVELAQDLDLSDGRDRKAFLLILQPHLLQGHQVCNRERARIESNTTTSVSPGS